MPNNPVRKPVGCLFPRCACVEGRLGCPHEQYDMRKEHPKQYYDWVGGWPLDLDPYDEVKGG